MRKILLSLVMTLLATVCAFADDPVVPDYTITTDGDVVIVRNNTTDYGKLDDAVKTTIEGYSGKTTLKLVGKFSETDMQKLSSAISNNQSSTYITFDFSQAEFQTTASEYGSWNAQNFSYWSNSITTAILSGINITAESVINDQIFQNCSSLTTIKYKNMVADVDRTSNPYVISYVKSGNTADDTYFNNVLTKYNSGNNIAVKATSFDTSTGTLTLAALNKSVSDLAFLINGNQVKNITFPNGTTYEVASGKFTPASGVSSDITTWLKNNGYTVEGSFDKTSGTLTLATLSATQSDNVSVSTLITNLNDLTSKNDIKTIEFSDGSTYDVASKKLTATSTENSTITGWLTNNGYTVSSTEVKLGDFATWDPATGVLSLDYTTGNTLSSTLNGNSYQNILNQDAYKNNLTKIVVISEDADNKRFKADDLSSMINWAPETKIMDFTQALGTDQPLTSRDMKCKAIYLPSNITFPETSYYANKDAQWNKKTGENSYLLYVCQLDANGELTVGVASHDTDASHPADAVAAALANNPLEYPFSEATHITLVGNYTTNDQTAVDNFNANHALTTFDSSTGTLTLANLDSNLEGDGGIINNLANLSQKSDINVINYPDGSTYDVASKTLSTTSSSPTNITNWLTTNGYEVTSTVTKSFEGQYVKVVNGVTTLTIPANEVGDVLTGNIDNSTKLTIAEKNALKAATNLVIDGPVTENDWYGLRDIAATTLDLSAATNIGSTYKLEGKLRESVQNLTLPDNAQYTSVPADFAYNATALQSVTFPNRITTIGENAFFGCSNLASVDLPDNLTTIGASAFSKSGLTELVLPGKLTNVGTEAFFNCGQLENVEMEMLDGSCTFGDRAFGSCFQLKHVTLSEGVTAISTQMFDKCGMLESIRIPSSCETIGQQAFNICASLHSIVIPVGVKTIEKAAFTNSGITDVYVMATRQEDVPEIYCMTGLGANDGTFSSGMVTSDSWDPYDTHKDEIASASDEKILSWYQDDRSNAQLGLGGGSCMVRLHYPEEMKSFYDGYETPVYNSTDWVATDGSILTEQQLADDKKTAMINGGYISSAYAVGSTQYPAFGPQVVTDGETTTNVYWPRRTDYALRLRAGDPQYYNGDNTVPTKIGWRQLPLHQVSKPDDFIFTKEYDDTWYTMCFPWDMEDNTLFSTFNQKLEIVEFVGAEVVEDNTKNPKQLNLIFHFDKVANTYYMTEKHRTDGLEYERVEDHIVGGKNTTRTEEITIEGNVIKKKYYTYHRIKGNTGPEYVYWPFDVPANKNAEDYPKDDIERYESIRHYMVFAGHPYMIHPSIGANPEKGTKKCTIAGVKKLQGVDFTQLAVDSAVTKLATTDGTFQHPGVHEYDGTSAYTFIGNIKDTKDQNNTTTNRSYMTDSNNKHAYFLAVDLNAADSLKWYPKYFRKSHGNENSPSWSQYSAIIRPNDAAIENIERYMNLSTYGSSAAKPFDVQFGKWEVVDVTAIEEIISEAERKNQPVEKVHLNVVFNIKGQVIREGADSVEGLPKGLYIVNGKKYMVK